MRGKVTTERLSASTGPSGSASLFLTVKELSEYLHIKPATLYAWAAQGKIPAIKLNGLVRFHREAIEDWLEASKQEMPQRRGTLPRRRPGEAVDELIARTRRRAYTPRHGETRPRSSPIGKEERDGAL